MQIQAPSRCCVVEGWFLDRVQLNSIALNHSTIQAWRTTIVTSFTSESKIPWSPVISHSQAIVPTHSNRYADFSLLLVAAIWGGNMAVMKLALNRVDPFVFNAVRLSLSAVVLAACVWLENRSRSKSRTEASLSRQQAAPSRLKKWSIIVAFALFTGGAYQILFAVGMNQTTAGNTALIMSSMPMWTAVLSFFLLREKLLWAWVGLTITFMGTVVVTLQKGNLSWGAENMSGNLLILIAALAWALGAVVSRPMLKFISPIQLAFYATVGTLPIHYAMPWVMDSQNADRIWEPGVVACILYSGIFSTGLAYAMWNYGVQQLGPSHASVYQNLVPLVALVAAWFLLQETVVPMQLVGGAMIIAGLLVTRRLRPRPPTPLAR